MATTQNETRQLTRLTALAACCLTILGLVARPADAATLTWDATTGLWSDGTNWVGGVAPVDNTTTDTAFFSQSNSNQTVQFSANRSITGITIANTGSTSLVSDSATARLLTLGASGLTVNAGAGVVTLGTSESPVNLAVTTSALTNNSSSLLTIGGNISRSAGDTTARTLTFTGSGNTTVSGSISNGGVSGSLGVTKSGAGTLTLSGGLGFTGPLTVNGGTAAVSNNASVGALVIGGSVAAAPALTISSGSLRFGVSGVANDVISKNAGERGILEISGSATVANNNVSTSFFYVGAAGAGVVRQSGGTATWGGAGSNAGFGFAQQANSYGAYVISGGTVTTAAGNIWFAIGNAGNALFQQSGGSVTVNATTQGVAFGLTSGAYGVADFSGGSFSTSSSFQIGSASAGTGVITVRGGAVQLGGVFNVTASNSAATGIVNLLSGTLEARQITKVSSATARATFNADGGTLKVFTTNAGVNFFSGLDNAFIRSGGLTVDTAGQNVTIAQVLSAPAGYGVLTSGSTLAVASGGSGYLAPPLVTFSAPAGGGVAATGLATIDANGTVTGITLTSAGSGYSSNETVTISYNGGSNASGAAVSVAPSFTTAASQLNSSGGLVKTGSGTLTLSAANTFTGNTRIGAGGLTLSNASALSASTLDMNAADAGTISFSQDSTIGGLTGSRDLNMSTRTLTIGGNGQSTTYSGVLSNGGLTKAGAGLLTLNGSNTFTGNTTVSAGTLAVNGSLAAGSAVLVGANGTLGGTGTINGATTILGAHTPGNSPGIQTFTSNLTYSGGNSTVQWELIGNTTTNQPNPDAIFDQIIVGGNLDFAESTTLSLSFNGTGSAVNWNDSFWSSNQSWTLYDVAGTTSNFGNLSINVQDWADGQLVPNLFNTARPASSFSLSQDGQNVILNYVAVPEPRAIALAGIGLVVAGWAASRRRHATS